MATLYIAEFTNFPITSNVIPPFAMTPPIAEQTVAIGTLSTACSAFNVNTNYVRIHTDAICSIEFSVSGLTPTATASKARMAANTTEYFGVQGGGKVAVITNS